MAELGEQLKQFPLKFKEKVARKATGVGADVCLAAVQTEAAKHARTWNLYHHIKAMHVRNNPIWNIEQFLVLVVPKGRGVRATRSRRKGASLPTPASGFSSPYYWYFQEFGTSKMKAHPFLSVGFLKSVSSAAQRIRDVAGSLIASELGK